MGPARFHCAWIFAVSDRACKTKKMAESRDFVPQLNYSNYQRWKYDMSAILEYRELLDIVEGKTLKPVKPAPTADNADVIAVVEENQRNWRKADARAKMVITSGLDEETHASIRGCQTSAEIWDKIKSLHEENTETNKYLLYQDFHQYSFKDAMTVAAYFSGLAVICQKLKTVGEEVPEAIIIAKVIYDMPANFDNFRQSYRIAATGVIISLKDIQQQLQTVEMEMKRNSAGTTSNSGDALVSKGRFQQSKKKRLVKKELRSCFHCKRVGYLKSKCPELW